MDKGFFVVEAVMRNLYHPIHYIDNHARVISECIVVNVAGIDDLQVESKVEFRAVVDLAVEHGVRIISIVLRTAILRASGQQ